MTLVPARAATIAVTTSADEWGLPGTNSTCSLREAVSSIDEAGDRGGCVKTGDAYGVNDRIDLETATYALTLPGADEDGNATGDLDVRALPTSAARDVTIAGDGSAVTILDGGDLDRLFHVDALATLRLVDLTVQNGTANYGGGIFVAAQGALTAERVAIAENRALGAEPSVGGGILAHGSLTLTDSTVRDNLADINGSNEGGRGGGIASSGALRLAGSTLSGNTAVRGGTLVYGWGGGLRLCQPAPTTDDEVITNSTISGNLGLVGGGISVGDGCWPAEAPEVIGTSAVPAEVGSGQLILDNVTISENYAGQDGGGVWVETALTLRNTVIAQNHAKDGDDCAASSAGVATSAGYNVLGEADVRAGTFACLDGSGTGDSVGSDASPVDAELKLLADNGGDTRTHALGPQSPLRDTGDPDGCEDETGAVLSTDQRGEPRPVGTRCDIGAFEAPEETAALDFYTLTPCRLLDTRDALPLAHGVERDVTVHGSCGVPVEATVAALNVTAAEASDPGELAAYPRDTPPPADAMLPFLPNRARANNALVGLAADGVSATATFPGAVGSVELVLDVNGYFAPNSPPVAVDDAFSIPSSSGATAFDVLANDTDAEGDPRLIVAVSDPPHGTVTITGGGTGLTYTPDVGYCSLRNGAEQLNPPDAFSYELSPGGSTAVVTVELTCSGCFAGGTLVWTETGLRPIEDILPGERVWARDESSGAIRLAPVEGVTTLTAPALLAIDLGTEVLRATAEHPFWTAAGWTRADALVPGDVLSTRDGAPLSIRRVDPLPGPATVYNLHVGELHTFFVGPSGILVHNK